MRRKAARPAPERSACSTSGRPALPSEASADDRAGEVDGELGEIGRAVAFERIERLGDLERVADGAPERLRHVADDRGHAPTGGCADLDHGAAPGRRAAARSRKKAPEPVLTSSTITCAPAASFFDMMLLAISGRLGTVPVTSLCLLLSVRIAELSAVGYQLSATGSQRSPAES